MRPDGIERDVRAADRRFLPASTPALRATLFRGPNESRREDQEEPMNRTFLAAVASTVLMASAALVGRAEDAESLQAKYEEKVAESWFKDNGFTDDFDAAKA